MVRENTQREAKAAWGEPRPDVCPCYFLPDLSTKLQAGPARRPSRCNPREPPAHVPCASSCSPTSPAPWGSGLSVT